MVLNLPVLFEEKCYAIETCSSGFRLHGCSCCY
jgi:hypothetical protein